jgi:hypothetical protein
VSEEAPISLDVLADSLRDLGYDIEPAQPGVPSGASLVARRDRGERVIVLALDAGGRFRIDLTWTIGEWSARDELAGVPLRVVDTVSRSTNVVGYLARPEQILGVVAALGEIVDWAAPADRNELLDPEFPPPP